jgi:hypothetical protein
VSGISTIESIKVSVGFKKKKIMMRKGTRFLFLNKNLSVRKKKILVRVEIITLNTIRRVGLVDIC